MNFENIKQLIEKSNVQNSIGTKQERTLHQYLKYYFCEESKYHEQKCNGYIVDIFKDQQIIEIQTSSFNAMRKKLETLLPDYKITIVYPIIQERTLYNFNDLGELENIRKSPKREHPLKIGKELYKINHLLNHKNLSFIGVVLKVYEERIPYINRYKQRRMTRINQIPYELVAIINFKNPADFKYIIPFDNEFTALDFKKKIKLSPRDTASTLISLRTLEAIEITRKEGKKYIYQIKE